MHIITYLTNCYYLTYLVSCFEVHIFNVMFKQTGDKFPDLPIILVSVLSNLFQKQVAYIEARKHMSMFMATSIFSQVKVDRET